MRGFLGGTEGSKSDLKPFSHTVGCGVFMRATGYSAKEHQDPCVAHKSCVLLGDQNGIRKCFFPPMPV